MAPAGQQKKMFSGVSAASGEKDGQAIQENKLLGIGCGIGGCWVSHFAIIPESVGWVECNETQQSFE